MRRSWQKLLAWQAVAGRDAIQRQFRFADFNEAFGFMTRVAIKAQEMDHHPEWFERLRQGRNHAPRHDVDGLTDRDIELARFIDSVLPQTRNTARRKFGKRCRDV